VVLNEDDGLQLHLIIKTTTC